jgi:hypothetical protein
LKHIPAPPPPHLRTFNVIQIYIYIYSIVIYRFKPHFFLNKWILHGIK